MTYDTKKIRQNETRRSAQEKPSISRNIGSRVKRLGWLRLSPFFEQTQGGVTFVGE